MCNFISNIAVPINSGRNGNSKVRESIAPKKTRKALGLMHTTIGVPGISNRFDKKHSQCWFRSGLLLPKSRLFFSSFFLECSRKCGTFKTGLQVQLPSTELSTISKRVPNGLDMQHRSNAAQAKSYTHKKHLNRMCVMLSKCWTHRFNTCSEESICKDTHKLFIHIQI